MGLACFRCFKEMPLTLSIGRRDECPHCGADVHVCRNCRFYEPAAYNECREPVAERVKDKERANFCAEFKVRAKADAEVAANDNSDNKPTEREDLLAQAHKLFK